MRPRHRNLWRRAAGVAVVATLAATVAAAPAHAGGGFYDTPASLPPNNGDIIRAEPFTFYLDPLKVIRAPGSAYRIMYRSTDRTGTPIAVTGSVLVPTTQWTGGGARPIVAYAVGTQGLGDQCAPSRQMAAGTEYEGVFISGLLARGYAVVVADYQGLGTEGEHTYMSREVTGRAVLDSIRAAQRLTLANLPADGPVAVTGYSQGGQAASAAAELAASYAPELRLKGVVAGAVPADLTRTAQNLDGSLYFAFLGYALAGLSASYDIDTAPYLNATGERVLADLKGQCTAESLLKYPFVRSSTLTEDGRPVTDHLGAEPFKSVLAEQVIGAHGRRPNVPTLVTHSMLDDVIPYDVGKAMAKRWCNSGAKVWFSANVAPTHVGGALDSYPESFAFLEARFAGLPALSNCWLL
ncbi:MAG TPA: alpha/beta fold hydrolase [Micromonosporaceae bacterium]